MIRFSKRVLGETFSEEKVLPQTPFQKTLSRCFASLFLLTAFVAQANEVDRLIRDLAGNNEQARVVARQELPRHGMDAAPALVDLLKHDEQPVWRAAKNILRDIAHGGTVGRTHDERAILASLVSEEIDAANPDVKQRLMDVLTYCAPEGFALGPVAELLHDEDLRMDARGTLERIATDEAAKALATAPMDDTTFAVAIADSLATIDNDEARERLRTLKDDQRLPVKLAALRGLIPAEGIGIARDCAEALAQAKDSGEYAIEHDAFDVYLRVADAIAANGGNWDYAMTMYESALKHATNDVWRGAALSGIGRHGDNRAVETILAAVDKFGNNILPQAMMAMNDLHGRASYNAMLAVYDDAPAAVKHGLLGVFGRSGDPVFAGKLMAAAEGGDETLRAAAVEALMAGAHPQAANVVSEYAESLEGEPRKYAMRSIKLYAETLRAQNAGPAAGRVYVAIHNLAETDADRDIALAGIKQFPSEAGLDVIMEDIDMDALDTLSMDTLVALAEALHGAEMVEDRDKVLAAIMGNLKGASAFQSVAAKTGGEDVFAPLRDRLGVVRNWHCAGPFPWKVAQGFEKNAIDAPDVNLDATYEVNGQTIAWKPFRAEGPIGMAPLMGIIGAVEHATAFAHAKFECSEATKGQIRAGSDDGIRIWLNGKLVHENHIDRGAALDQDVIPVEFNKGTNTLVAEITQNAGGWAFLVRLTKEDGTPLPITQE